jgi:exportin-7
LTIGVGVWVLVSCACFAQEMQEHLRQAPGLLPEILKSLFEIILFEENSNQWSLSRPMLSLILVNEQVCVCK